MDTPQSICLVSSGLTQNNLRLQPWRYLYQIAHRLQNLGHEVTIISDGAKDGPTIDRLGAVQVRRLKSVSNPAWRFNNTLLRELQLTNPDITLWHLGLTSLIHQRLDFDSPGKHIGIFTSPIYQLHELTRLGLGKILRGYKLSLVHLAGALTPPAYIKRRLQDTNIDHWVVQTSTTRDQLLELGLRKSQISVIPPGVDEIWTSPPGDNRSSIRVKLESDDQDFLIIYFGSPAALRGVHTLIQAFELIWDEHRNLKLVIMSRHRQGELQGEQTEMMRRIGNNKASTVIRVIEGYLSPSELLGYIDACDLVALPFELLPSDAPLSLLEAQARGKAILTTDIACLPELVVRGNSYLADPGDPASLAKKILQAANDHNGAKHEIETDIIWTPRPPTRGWIQMGEEWSQLIKNL